MLTDKGDNENLAVQKKIDVLFQYFRQQAILLHELHKMLNLTKLTMVLVK